MGKGALPAPLAAYASATVWGRGDPSVYSSDAEIRTRLTHPGRAIGFKGFLERHPRYNVVAAQEVTDLAGRRLKGTDWKALWKKTSKAGLEYQVQEYGGTVHFVVSELLKNLHVVVAKKGYGQSITSSEIRWLYRHKDTEAVRNRVRFWNHSGEVSHEEVFGAAAWRDYAPKHRYDSSWDLNDHKW